MTGESAIRLSQEGEDGVALLARVFGGRSSDAMPTSMSEVVVPPRGEVSVAVDPGLYSVQLLLPSGAIIQRRCRVGLDQQSVVVFDARSRKLDEVAGGERFSLQGAVADAAPEALVELAARRMPVRAHGSASATKRRSPRPKVAAKAQRGRKSFGDAEPRVFALKVPATRAGAGLRGGLPQAAMMRAHVVLAIGPDLVGETSWTRLGKNPSPRRRGVAESTSILPATEPRDGVELFTLPNGSAGAGRAWALVEGRGGIEIASLPLPWPTTGSTTSIELLVDGRVGGRAMTSVALRESGIGGLLAYLDNGRLSLVGPFLDLLEANGSIERAIYGDQAGGLPANPLAACVAAYARLATVPRERSPRWDRWLEDLMERNPALPDCAIVHARSVVLRPGDSDVAGEAPRAVARAFHAGVPFFSVGLQLMRDMLVGWAGRSEADKVMLAKVMPVARRCDPTGMVTVLRYPELRA